MDGVVLVLNALVLGRGLLFADDIDLVDTEKLRKLVSLGE